MKKVCEKASLSFRTRARHRSEVRTGLDWHREVLALPGGRICKAAEAYPKVREAATKALALDEHDAEAHCYLGEVKCVLDREYRRRRG